MRRRLIFQGWMAAAFCLFLVTGQAQYYFSEILFNPPGRDLPHEYIELRAAPNLEFPEGAYIVVVEGDVNGNPGVVQNIFDLSHRRVGGNGFLVLLQKTNVYEPNPHAVVLANLGVGEGWGSGSGSSVGHDGDSGQVDLENGSSTFFLMQSQARPEIGDDLDEDDDGVPEAEFFASWTVWDSVAVLDDDVPGGYSYGALTFRRNLEATVLPGSVVVDVDFTPDYVGRIGFSTGHEPTDWVCSGSLENEAPDFSLGEGDDTEPLDFADAPLDHLGGPNFGAAERPGVVVLPTAARTTVGEDGMTDAYGLVLNTPADGQVVVEIQAEGQVEFSLDGGVTFGESNRVVLSASAPVDVRVRTVDDNYVEASPHLAWLHHRVVASGDLENYPTNSLIPDMRVEIEENDRLLLSELKINPPGPDGSYEFVEIKGVPGAWLTNVYLLAVEGDSSSDPGTANVVIDLTSVRIGNNGLLVIGATTNPYPMDAATTYVPRAELDRPEGGFSNGSVSFLLCSTKEAVEEGKDLDKGDNGKAEDLPEDLYLMDAVGWTNGDTNDWIYGGVELRQASGTPDAATRFPGNDTPLSAEAWFNGNLRGQSPEELVYDADGSSGNFSSGTSLSPGRANDTAPRITFVPAISGVIGDPTNPELVFSVTDHERLPEAIPVRVESDNHAVVPPEGLVLTSTAPGEYRLRIEPIGVGYATVTILAEGTTMTGQMPVAYAASAEALPSSRFHLQAADASTALPIEPDLMLVGDDETQVIRLYRRQESGLPVRGYNVGPFLNLTDIEDNVPREVDIEGSARVGDIIYWMGSHSHANIGEVRTNRARMFATRVVEAAEATELTYLGHYEHLKRDLVEWDINNGHGRGANYLGLAVSAADGYLPKDPYGGGFNIEGLAMAPGSTNVAWLGFRAPIVPATNRLYSLIVPVLNFHHLAVHGGGPGTAVFGDIIELDFQGRGIRSIAGDTNGYLIVTGPPGDIPTPFPPSNFKLYVWSGDPADAPQQLAADLLDLNPEAIVELPPRPWTEESQFQIISDNGRQLYYNDGIQGKFLPVVNHKKFRSDWITFGPVVKPQPFLIRIERGDDWVTLVWRTNIGDAYVVESKASFDDTWEAAAEPVVANDLTTMLTLTNQVQGQHFYRVVLLP